MADMGRRSAEMPNKYSEVACRQTFRDATHHLKALCIAHQAGRVTREGVPDEYVVEWTNRLEAEMARVREVVEFMLDAVSKVPMS